MFLIGKLRIALMGFRLLHRAMAARSAAGNLRRLKAYSPLCWVSTG